jgi:hypothetical protein
MYNLEKALRGHRIVNDELKPGVLVDDTIPIERLER